VTLGGRTLAAVESGAALALFSADGRLAAAATARTADDLRVPFAAAELYRVTWVGGCVDVGSLGWRDVTSAAAGGRLVLRIDNYRPYDAAATLVLRPAAPAKPRVRRMAGVGEPHVTVEDAAAMAPARSDLPPGWTLGPLDTRVGVVVNDEGRNVALIVDAGVPVTAAWVNGRADRIAAPRVKGCTAPPGGYSRAT
jgi:hypothetical protein